MIFVLVDGIPSVGTFVSVLAPEPPSPHFDTPDLTTNRVSDEAPDKQDKSNRLDGTNGIGRVMCFWVVLFLWELA